MGVLLPKDLIARQLASLLLAGVLAAACSRDSSPNAGSVAHGGAASGAAGAAASAGTSAAGGGRAGSSAGGVPAGGVGGGGVAGTSSAGTSGRPSAGEGGASSGASGEGGAEGGESGAGGSAGETPDAEPRVGGGTIEDPAAGPGPGYEYDGDLAGYVLVKNWDFGDAGTIRSIADLSDHFQYWDQFGQIANGGGKYGAYTVAPDAAHALNESQPVEGVNTDRPVREFFPSSLRTYLVGLDGATEVNPSAQKAGCGSFQARWTLPAGGSRLGMDLIWETRVRYVTPPYFWFAIWTAGNQWNGGAEMDVVESFGYDNGGGNTNYAGRYWHSSVVGGVSETNYHANWGAGMEAHGIVDFDASEYHTWTWIYRADDSFESYVDGVLAQRGFLEWTYGATADGEPIDMSFIFDGAWGHTEVTSVNHTLPVTELAGKYYEWDFSRVYLREATP